MLFSYQQYGIGLLLPSSEVFFQFPNAAYNLVFSDSFQPKSNWAWPYLISKPDKDSQMVVLVKAAYK